MYPFDDPDALAMPAVSREHRPDGSFVLRCVQPLEAYERCIGNWLEHWASAAPEQSFLCERDARGAWTSISYKEARRRVGRLAQGLIDADLPPDRPVVILSDNSIDSALVKLAALHIGRPVCVLPSEYGRRSDQLRQFIAMLDQLNPALVYASDGDTYGQAMAAWGLPCPVVYSQNFAGHSLAYPLSALADVDERACVMQAFERITPHTHAKYMVVQKSSGATRVVVNTHRMLCANQQMLAQVWPFLRSHPIILLDWLPWSRPFGGNQSFNTVLANGGTLYIDDGRPRPGLIDRTLRNLHDVRPTMIFNVARGIDMLLPHLESDDTFARTALERLEVVFCAPAPLPEVIRNRLELVAKRVRQRPLWISAGWGSTETSPACTIAHSKDERPSSVGLPLPGVELKFARRGTKLEMRVRGPHVFPGYLGPTRLSGGVFDAEGFFKMTDAGKLVDPSEPSSGVALDGRADADVKLSSGIWVSAESLRRQALTEMAPHVTDVIVTGHGRPEIGLLIFPSPHANQLRGMEFEQHIADALRRIARAGRGSARCPTRALVQAEPPSSEAGEIGENGCLNPLTVMSRRRSDIAALYGGDNSRVIRI